MSPSGAVSEPPKNKRVERAAPVETVETVEASETAARPIPISRADARDTTRGSAKPIRGTDEPSAHQLLRPPTKPTRGTDEPSAHQLLRPPAKPTRGTVSARTALAPLSAQDRPQAGTPAAPGDTAGGGTDLRAVAAAEYAGRVPGYLNTAAAGLAPARTVTALRAALDAWAAGRPDLDGYEAAVAASRAAYARITGVPVESVALAGTVAGGVGLIASALPTGAEVVVAADDFSSLVHPFAAQRGLSLRIVPLAEVADAIRPGTALVAVSAAQSLDGRVADLFAIRTAAALHGARVLVDGTQAVGWLPLHPDSYDYLICHSYKWLVSPHGACFLTIREGLESTLSPGFAGWYSGADPWDSCYGPVADLAPGARQFDMRPAYLPFVGAAASLSLIEELGVETVHAHDTALAARLRGGLTVLGHSPVPGDSAIVAVPGMPAAATLLAEAGVSFSARGGNLRFALHLHNTEADVDLVLDALA